MTDDTREHLQHELEQGPWNVTRDEYHRCRQCLSNSALSDFRASVPLFHGRHVTGEIPPKDSTDAMNLGTALHLLALEPERFDAEVAIAPDVDRRTKEGKAAWFAFTESLLESVGPSAFAKLVITQEQHDTCRRMADAIRRDDMAWNLIDAPGRAELPIRWQHAESGLWVRNLLDKRIEDGPFAGVIVDLKTSSDPAPGPFAKSAANFGYHCQAALYARGAEACFGSLPDFVFIVVGSSEPHEVACYVLDGDAFALGDRLNNDALGEIAERKRTNAWGSRWANRVQTLSLPRWAASA